MEESALEVFFDKYILNDSRREEEKEKEKEEEEERQREELFFSLLPDELLTLYKSSQEHTAQTDQTAQKERTAMLPHSSSSSLDYNSQNSTSAPELPERSSVPPAVTLQPQNIPQIHRMSLQDSRREEKEEEEFAAAVLPHSSSSLDYNSQNSTSAPELPERSSVPPAVTLQPQNIPQIQNVICTVKLGCCLDLAFIARKAWNVEYNPKLHKSIRMRIHKPRTSAIIWKSGSIICTGAKSMEDARRAARRYARIIQKLGFPVCFRDFKVHNVVASYETFQISLERLSLAHYKDCSYEPELFAGLHYYVKPGITATIFSSGKMYLTGAKTEAAVYDIFDGIYPILSRFRR